VSGEPDEERPELALVLNVERAKQFALGSSRRLARSFHGLSALGCQLDPMATTIGRIGGAGQKSALLELIEERDEIARLDSERHRQIALRDRPLRVEMVEHGELGPPEPALPEAAAEPPGGGAGEAEDQEPETGTEGGVPGFSLCLGGRLGSHVRGITYIR
jgi:hypothetical protein